MFHDIYTVSGFAILGPYSLRVTFNDGSVTAVNLAPMLRGEMYGPLRDLAIFNQVSLDDESGSLVWPNGADFDPATLHDWDSVGEAMVEMAASWPDFPQLPSSAELAVAVP